MCAVHVVCAVCVKLTSDKVRVTVARARIDDERILNDDNIRMLYVEYNFIGIPLEETETPTALEKQRGKTLDYNFTRGRYDSMSSHSCC